MTVTDVRLLAIGCPPGLNAVAREFYPWVVERFGSTPEAERDAFDVLVGLIDEPLTVLAEGSCHDLFGQLEPEIRDYARRFAGHREGVTT